MRNLPAPLLHRSPSLSIKGIERSFIKCYDVGRNYVQRSKAQYTPLITLAKGVVFVVTGKSAVACAGELALTKDLGKARATPSPASFPEIISHTTSPSFPSGVKRFSSRENSSR